MRLRLWLAIISILSLAASACSPIQPVTPTDSVTPTPSATLTPTFSPTPTPTMPSPTPTVPPAGEDKDPWEEVILKADVVLAGIVTGLRYDETEYTGTMGAYSIPRTWSIRTTYTLAIDKVLKGDPKFKEVFIEVPGGRQGESEFEWDEEILGFGLSDEIVVCLSRSATATFTVLWPRGLLYQWKKNSPFYNSAETVARVTRIMEDNNIPISVVDLPPLPLPTVTPSPTPPSPPEQTPGRYDWTDPWKYVALEPDKDPLRFYMLEADGIVRGTITAKNDQGKSWVYTLSVNQVIKGDPETAEVFILEPKGFAPEFTAEISDEIVACLTKYPYSDDKMPEAINTSITPLNGLTLRISYDRLIWSTSWPDELGEPQWRLELYLHNLEVATGRVVQILRAYNVPVALPEKDIPPLPVRISVSPGVEIRPERPLFLRRPEFIQPLCTSLDRNLPM